MQSWRGLATGIGSLPYKDPGEAVNFILSCTPELPFWPQLPRRDPREGMTAQFTENMPCLHVCAGGVVYSGEHRDAQLERFYERLIARDIEYFRLSREYAPGVYALRERLRHEPAILDRIVCIKCHITGPLTFATGIKDEKGRALLHDEVMMQVFISGLVMKAVWQIGFFKEFGKGIIVFIDEPYLAGFGSAYTPVTREQVVRILSEVSAPIRDEGAFAGVHCCGNTDWTIFTGMESISIINFDAYGFLDKFVPDAGDLTAFLRRGGYICWGIVPTTEPRESLTPSALLSRLYGGIQALVRRGVDEGLLRERILLSPGCGLGTLDVSRAESALKLLAATSAAFRNFS